MDVKQIPGGITKLEFREPEQPWREFGRALTEPFQKLRVLRLGSAPAQQMRRTADVDPDLLRTAEIRALTNPS